MCWTILDLLYYLFFLFFVFESPFLPVFSDNFCIFLEISLNDFDCTKNCKYIARSVENVVFYVHFFVKTVKKYTKVRSKSIVVLFDFVQNFNRTSTQKYLPLDKTLHIFIGNSIFHPKLELLRNLEK